MSVYGDRAAEAIESLFDRTGGTAATYTQGATSVSVTNAWQGPVTRTGGDGELDEERCPWRFIASDLSTVYPSPGDRVTSGGITWRVAAEPGSVARFLSGAGWVVQTTRRVSRSTA